MKKIIYLTLSLLLIIVNSSILWAADSARGDVLIFEGTALTVKPLVPPATADAVENTSNFKGLKEVVRFQVTKIIKGSLEESRPELRSMKSQFKNIFRKREDIKQFNSHSNTEELEYSKFKIAVSDGNSVFKLTPEELGKARYRLYFKQYKDEATTFVMGRFEKLS